MSEENKKPELENEEEIREEEQFDGSLNGLYAEDSSVQDEELPEEEEVEPIREKTPKKPPKTPWIRLSREEKKKRALKEIREWVVSIAVAVAAVLILKNFLFVPITVDGLSMNPTLLNGDKLFVTAYDVNVVNKLEKGDVVICHYPGRTSKHAILKFLTVKTDFVKRIVGMPGDTVSRVQGVTFINGEPLDPRAKTTYSMTYEKTADGLLRIFYNGIELLPVKTDDGSVRYSTGGNYTATLESLSSRYKFDYSYVLGEDEYFVVGDNRYNSHDCRAWNGPDLPYYKVNNASGHVGPLKKSMITGHVRSVFWPTSRWMSVENDPNYMYPTDRME